jgi:alpha-ketoglutarate-dependent taurine dioxygenase
MNDARAALDDILASESAFCYRLKAGDGLLCNNVLHRRSAFDDPNRLLYRGRFLDYISETE